MDTFLRPRPLVDYLTKIVMLLLSKDKYLFFAFYFEPQNTSILPFCNLYARDFSVLGMTMKDREESRWSRDDSRIWHILCFLNKLNYFFLFSNNRYIPWSWNHSKSSYRFLCKLMCCLKMHRGMKYCCLRSPWQLDRAYSYELLQV